MEELGHSEDIPDESPLRNGLDGQDVEMFVAFLRGQGQATGHDSMACSYSWVGLKRPASLYAECMYPYTG